MRGLKSAASIAALVLLAACSTVKLDDQAPVEERAAKSSSPSSATASSAIPAGGVKASGAKNGASGKDAAARDAASAAAARDAAAKEASASGAAGAGTGGKDPLNEPGSVLINRSVYFDFDSFMIRDEFKSMVEAHGKFLSSNPERKVVVQGHTDERGGSEYNLALGQKRAEAVRRALEIAGAKDSQLEAVSFGKEKPKAVGSNEEAWAQNRRADIAY